MVLIFTITPISTKPNRGRKYYFNYELGYLELEEEQFALVKKNKTTLNNYIYSQLQFFYEKNNYYQWPKSKFIR